MSSQVRGSPASEACDVLVAGGGGAGLSAAIAASERGADVVLVEKMDEPGGATGISVGTITAAGTPLQEAAGIRDDVDTHFRDYLEFIPPGETPADYDLDLTRLLIESAPGVLRRMIDLGLRFTGPHPEPPHSVPRMHNAAPGSMAYIDALRLAAERAGAVVRTRTRLFELERTSTGRVTGAVLEDSGTGRRTRLRAGGGVVLATGYYSANDDLARRYGRPPEMEGIGTLPEGATGDGMVAAMDVGAAVAAMDGGSSPSFRTPSPPYVRPEPHLFEAGAILVDSGGRRFANELDGPETVASRLPGGGPFIVFDSQLAARIAVAEDDSGPGRNGWHDSGKLFLSTFPAIAYAYLDDYRTRTGYYFESHTACGLAEQIGVPPDALERTLKEVDRIVMGEARDPFGRRSFGPGPFRPPFHAIGPLRTFIASTGGLKVDADMRVLDTTGAPIDGLYAAGINAASNALIAGHGHALVWAFATGRIAGTNAAAGAAITQERTG